MQGHMCAKKIWIKQNRPFEPSCAGGRIVVLALGFVVSSLSSPSLLAVSFSPFL
jgi:hypothetical protein